MSKKTVKKSELDPKSLSVQYDKQVLRFSGVAHTRTMQIYFKDGSRLDFELNFTNPNPRTVGGEGATAQHFASDIKQFSLEPQKKQVGFVFKDNSRWDLNIGSATR